MLNRNLFSHFTIAWEKKTEGDVPVQPQKSSLGTWISTVYSEKYLDCLKSMTTGILKREYKNALLRE